MKAATANRLESPLVLSARTAEELMIPNPISLRAEAGISEAIALFTEKGITAAPVIDEAGHPIGVVSRSDLLVHQRECAMHRDDYFFAPTFDTRDAAQTGPAGTVADLMTPAVFGVSPDTPASRVVNDMVGLHVHRLFVVDSDGALVGVISAMDVLKQLRPQE